MAIVLALVGCGEPRGALQPVARVGGLVLDARVVEHVAARDGLAPAEAQTRAVDTLRLVAAGREQHAQGRSDPGPVLAPRRAEHLRRAARARLWLTERFELEHGPETIPEDDPRLVRARQDPRIVHPELHVVCQVVVEPPPAVTEIEAKAAITADPAWREAATRTLAPILARIDRNVPVADTEACALMDRELQLSGESSDPRLHVSRPQLGGFDLDACVKTDETGACVQPRFDPEWTAVVRALPAPGRSTPFFTRFGLHVVQLQERMPPQPAGDPATEQAVRAAVLDAWRSDALGRRLDELQHERTVRMVDPRTVEGLGGEP